MNVIFISPDFPTNYKYFCKQLNNIGINVLGVGEQDFGGLDSDLQHWLNWYCKVYSLNDYNSVRDRVAFLISKFGKPDYIECLNETWLMLCAKLREEFGVPGLNAAQTVTIRNKSAMKETFAKFNIPSAKYKLIHSKQELAAFAGQVNFPIIVKPDAGVGAINAARLNSYNDLDGFWNTKPDGPYLAEEYIQNAVIETFDGLCDKNGNTVFISSFQYAILPLEALANKTDVFYYTLLKPKEDICALGFEILKAFNVKSSFFHFEIFRKLDGGLSVIEVNMRPPGGLSLDMFNYSADADVFSLWAKVIRGDVSFDKYAGKYYTAYIGLRNYIPRKHNLSDSLNVFSDNILISHTMQPLYREAMGDYAVIMRNVNEKALLENVKYIMEPQ